MSVFLLIVFLFMGEWSGVKAQVSVEAEIDSLELLIGDQTRIRLEVSMDANQKLQLPIFTDTIISGIEVVEIVKPDTQMLNNKKRWLVSQEYTITSFDSALYFLPPFEVMVNDKEYRSESLALKVYSMPVDTLHPDQFFGPKDVWNVPIEWNDVAPLTGASFIFLIFIVLSVFLIIRYVNNKPIIKIIKIEPKLPAHQTALAKIEDIKSDKNMQRTDPKQYYTQLTDAIRGYIQERFGFNALEMTSSEIIDSLLEVKDKESIKDLKYLFEMADLVKFAKFSPMMNENDMNLVNAIDFINETKIEEEPAAKKEPTEMKVEEKRSKRGRIALICSISVSLLFCVMSLYVIVRNIIDLFF